MSLKVATADGGTDVTQVIAAIDWVVQHRDDDGRNIRVLNLSYGTNSLQAYKVDPLAFAVEQAWKAGIVVVVAAGNTGYQRGNGAPGLADPAYNPFVIGVGGYDTKGTARRGRHRGAILGELGRLRIGLQEPRLRGCRLASPGAARAQLLDRRAPPRGLHQRPLFPGQRDLAGRGRHIGCGRADPDRFPGLTPDQVKRFIADNGKKVPGYDSQAQGGGEIAFARLLGKRPAAYTQKFKSADGTGSLEKSRGQDHLRRDGVRLDGGVDIFGHDFDADAMASLEASGRSWSGHEWNGSLWDAPDWTGRSWSGRSWSTGDWTANSLVWPLLVDLRLVRRLVVRFVVDRWQLGRGQLAVSHVRAPHGSLLPMTFGR